LTHIKHKNSLFSYHRQFSLETIIPSVKEPLANLKSTIEVDPNSHGTLTISSSIQLQRFETLELKISSTTGESYQILSGSTISLVVIGMYVLFTQRSKHPTSFFVRNNFII